MLRFRERIYLRPESVLPALHSALPTTPSERAEAAAALERLAAELAPLSAQKAALDAAAHRRAHRVMWLGLAALTTQTAIFYRLTVYDL